VIERDVAASARAAATEEAEPSKRAEPPKPAAPDHIVWQTPTPAQRLAVERTAAAFATAPHFYLTAEADAEALVEVRGRLLPAVERKAGVRLTFTDLLARTLVVALAGHPLARGFWDGGRIGVYDAINVGIATATEAGLLAPVIQSADRLPLSELARERHRLVTAARAGALSPDDLTGGVATLTNLGGHRVDQFQPVLNSPQSVILAAGRIAPRPYVAAGQLVVRHTVFLTLACDHRVLDGEAAARFLDSLVRCVEEPFDLLV
jgi:pyruvate dehydrogenase E2 component (dihydrolipoamide acetyltransferase)